MHFCHDFHFPPFWFNLHRFGYFTNIFYLFQAPFNHCKYKLFRFYIYLLRRFTLERLNFARIRFFYSNGILLPLKNSKFSPLLNIFGMKRVTEARRTGGEGTPENLFSNWIWAFGVENWKSFNLRLFSLTSKGGVWCLGHQDLSRFFNGSQVTIARNKEDNKEKNLRMQ